ncbi:MAG: Allophanate hydrolase 2 subunit 1 [Hydrogenibacillus schlegelii]|uniref:Allophanate hydrolase 2 subunit 1 n=1 Tax=Hydrogenibacillus schlegelii TaxID=1484 RepID=A0A2T5GCJ7_HYDSH|nr:5-oxoprolinase subunit PxpB [Hydrogenibacillus schlegelii]PTQ53912.1 MAG: Allophanate hydrolase 2 subunit 1 [Hydrogenibacillus schlegelii]
MAVPERPQRWVPLGEGLLLLEFADRPSPAVTEAIVRVRDRLLARPFPGLLELIPGYTTLGLLYDPEAVVAALGGASDGSGAEAADPAEAARRLAEASLNAGEDPAPDGRGDRSPPSAASGEAPRPAAEPVEIPVRYDGEDLEALAERTGLSREDIVRLHSGTIYTVYMIGFMPGFPYLGEVPEPLRVPRRSVPRTRVPAGAVGIAGAQTGIYPYESPGGWWIIGHTPVKMFDPAADPPVRLRIGDRVRFVPVE